MPPERLREALGRLHRWLVDDAYPLWARAGVDRARGGFQERLNQDATPTVEPRRARVQARQAYAFAQAPRLGWQGDAASIVEQGLGHFLRRFRRGDDLFRTGTLPGGEPADEHPLLYDQAFALLAFAEAQRVLGKAPWLIQEGRQLRAAIETHLKRSGPGFATDPGHAPPLLANPHMHLLEAALAWSELGEDPEWRFLAGSIATLALLRMIDRKSFMLREVFDESWAPHPGPIGRIVEPGHMFEWAWLLLRWCGDDTATREAALRLIEVAEARGIRGGVAIHALLDDGTVHDPDARLWQQTERLKAHLLAAALTGDERRWSAAEEVAQGLLLYLETPVRGLWWDRRKPDGSFVDEPAPASSFYHIVSAVAEADRLLGPAPKEDP
jgi:mannose-6-phosphate isomerase